MIRLHVLARNPAPRPGLCLLLEDGRVCPWPAAFRGLCSVHYGRLRAQGRLEGFALPRRTSADRKHTFRVAPEPDPATCRLVVNGEPCRRPATTRGLCDAHYTILLNRPDLRLDDFALRSSRPPPVRSGDRPTCPAVEGGVTCGRPVRALGLCFRHYQRDWRKTVVRGRALLRRNPDPRYSLRVWLRDGRCRVAEKGVGCPALAITRGLCSHHYKVLRRRQALLAEIALPSRARARRILARADERDPLPVCCVVIENGVRCSRPPVHRGLCHDHYRFIRSSDRYRLDDFRTPAVEMALTRKPREETADGLCVVVQDGKPCQEPPRARGLCARHSVLARERGLVETLANPPSYSRYNVFGAGNDRPHVYLDRNVLLDHADHALFGTTGRESSIDLVERVRRGLVRASVSIDAVKSTYGHLRQRLVQPEDQGGGGLPEEAAEEKAREHVERTFCGPGAFRLLALDSISFQATVRSRAGSLSLEDRLEFQTFQSARVAKAGPSLFVTRDAVFPEGVHPADVLRTLGKGAGRARTGPRGRRR